MIFPFRVKQYLTTNSRVDLWKYLVKIRSTIFQIFAMINDTFDELKI